MGKIREEERSGLGVIFTAKSGISPEQPSEMVLAGMTPAPGALQPPQELLGSPAREV